MLCFKKQEKLLKLSVIIVNYNVRRYLFQCLRSVLAATEDMDADVWVVDNASSDGSVPFLRAHFPSVHFVQNDDNVGFSRANNRAIRLSQGEYVLLLNPDTIATHSALTACVRWMDDHPEAGSTGAALYNAQGCFAQESRRGVPTPLVSFCKISGLNRLFPRHRVIDRYYMGYLDRTSASQIEILSGAYMMLRRKALEEVGLLDETFFMYGEDIDLSYRLLQAGWKNYYVPQPILHYKGESEHPSTIRYVNVFHQAMIIFYEKHFSHRYFLSGLLIRMAVYFKAFLTLLKHAVSGITLLLPRRTEYPRLCACCPPSHREELLRQVADLQGEVTFVDAVPSDLSAFDFLLFDATHTSYDEMLHALMHQQGRHRVCLATYTPELGILLP